MKRLIATLLTIPMLVGTLSKGSVENYEYTDVPTAMTQDSVFSVEATEKNKKDQIREDCAVEVLQPNKKSIALLDAIYAFVVEEENRPVRYYDEQTQQDIQSLCPEINIDILHMTEAMRLQLAGKPEQPVTVDMKLNVKYAPDQLVVVVLGSPQEDMEYIWYPYRAVVPETGLIRWEIPAEDWLALCNEPVSFHVLTTRMGPRGEIIWHKEIIKDNEMISSKDSNDVYHVYRWYTETGEVIEDNFRLDIVDLTESMRQEVLRIGEHIEQGGAILDYFPDEQKNEALLMLPENITAENLMAYDIIAMTADEYKDTYGDVNAELEFASCYDPEKAMVILAGFEVQNEQEQPHIQWYVLRGEAVQGNENLDQTNLVKIGLKQLNLIQMERQPMMLVVISELLEP
jgi:hypothetical protein